MIVPFFLIIIPFNEVMAIPTKIKKNRMGPTILIANGISDQKAHIKYAHGNTIIIRRLIYNAKKLLLMNDKNLFLQIVKPLFDSI